MIATLAISLVAVAAFGLCLGLMDVAGVARQVFQKTAAGLSAMMDPELDDNSKEAAVRSSGFALVRAAFGIFWRFALALGAAAGPIYAADAIGLATSTEVFALMLRLDYIVVVSVGMILAVLILRRLRGNAGSAVAAKYHYSATDRFFHELAFSNPAILKWASWIEDRIMLRAISDVSEAPIFITSLARGGTTALLNALHDVPGIATHIYRDLPFLTSPVLWYRLSGGEKRHVQRHQRAHGDGLEIDLDSPEAFEEILWKMFWPEKYGRSGIDLWRNVDHDPKAERFLRRHMAKIVHARRLQGRVKGAEHIHYCSKNNANISRLGFLVETFPDCRIVVPVRRPECHVASLLRQHRNFLKRQAEDDFIRRYMRDIGHFEFGSLHKPFLFPGFETDRYDPAEGDYWLNYWIHAFRHVLGQRDHCIFVLQDDLREASQVTMNTLCRDLGIDPGEVEFDQYFRQEPDIADTKDFDPKLLREANALYDQIRNAARQ